MLFLNSLNVRLVIMTLNLAQCLPALITLIVLFQVVMSLVPRIVVLITTKEFSNKKNVFHTPISHKHLFEKKNNLSIQKCYRYRDPSHKLN